ncbi:DUF4230 domain-containing protein [Eubacterium sp. MSJ-13]|uniref:DUF4230 domain-containing protein n=1 Tax=Eubacterium sp. MSJ-13 TaxID=2841513 RepID=UPI001C11FA9E|nr:DUF4230 domain-containing protein [Eubacterium sp. MSJ-13]MBU5479429.1 DUF4230 domain-containing protein [Eubacterium sp. MSJ-13]
MFVLRWFLGLGTRIKCIIITVLVCTLFFGGILLKVHFSGKSEPKVSYSNVYSEKVKGLSELAVLSTTYNGITEVRNKWFIDVLDEVALMEYKAQVKVGVDLSAADIKVDDKKKTIDVKLPAADAVEINIIKSSIKWDDVSWNKLEGKQFVKQGLIQAESECRDRIDETDMVEKANMRAKMLVEDIFEGAKKCREPYKVNVSIKDGDDIKENVGVTEQ